MHVFDLSPGDLECHCRCEEAELAAAVGSRRAVAAEARAADAEKRAKDLAWQIRMISEPQRIGGAAAPPGRIAAAMDMFGCAIRAQRRPPAGGQLQ